MSDLLLILIRNLPLYLVGNLRRRVRKAGRNTLELRQLPEEIAARPVVAHTVRSARDGRARAFGPTPPSRRCIRRGEGRRPADRGNRLVRQLARPAPRVLRGPIPISGDDGPRRAVIPEALHAEESALEARVAARICALKLHGDGVVHAVTRLRRERDGAEVHTRRVAVDDDTGQQLNLLAAQVRWWRPRRHRLAGGERLRELRVLLNVPALVNDVRGRERVQIVREGFDRLRERVQNVTVVGVLNVRSSRILR